MSAQKSPGDGGGAKTPPARRRATYDLLICGTLANGCVLVDDAVGSLGEGHKGYALSHVDWLFGEVTGLDEVAFA